MQIPPGGNPFDVLGAMLQSIAGDTSSQQAQPTSRGSSTSVTAWQPAPGATPVSAVMGDGGPFSLLGSHFDPRQAHALFDLGQLIGQVFGFMETLASSLPSPAAGASSKRAHGSGGSVATSKGAWSPAQPGPASGSVIPGLQVRASVGDRTAIQASGQHDAGFATLSGTAEASAYRGAGVHGQVTAGDGQVGVSGSAAAAIGAAVSAEGRIDTDLGSIDGRAEAAADVYARGQGYADASLNGVTAGAKAETGATAGARAEANANFVDGLVTGHADAFAESGSGATAEGRVGLQFSPPTAVVDGSAGAFAGARAGFGAKGGVSGASYGAEGEAWAGVGAKAEFHAGLDDDGVFRFQSGIGAALGVGAFFRVDAELDFKDPAKVAGGLAAVAGAFLGLAIGGLPLAVATAVTAGTGGKAVGDALGGIFGSVASLFGGGQGDASHAEGALSAALQRLPPRFTTGLGLPGVGDTPPERRSTVWTSDDDVDPHRAASFDERFANLKNPGVK